MMPRAGGAVVAFGDVVELHKERTTDPDADGYERYVGLEHLDPGDLRIRRWGDVADGTTFTSVFRPGHVLFGKRRAYQRKAAVSTFTGVCSGDIYVFKPRNGSLLPELLPYICQTEAFVEHAVDTSAGSLSPRTSWKHLSAFEFRLPSLDAQIKLVQLFESARRARDAVARCKEAARSTRAAYVNATLVDLAKSYPISRVTEHLDRATVGIVVRPADLYVDGGGVPALRSLNVAPGRLVWDEVIEISREGHNFHEKSALYAGDVVIVRSGRPGDAAAIPDGVGPLNCIDLIVASPGSTIRPRYLAAALNSAFGRRQFLSGSAGTAQKHFNVGSLGRIQIPIPPIEAQAELEGVLDRFESADAALTARMQRVSALYGAILNGVWE